MIRSLSGHGAGAPRNAGLVWPLVLFALVALTVPGPLHAQVPGEGDELPSAGEIVAEMFEREAQRSEGVDDFTKLMAGNVLANEVLDESRRARLPSSSIENAAIMEKVYCKLPSGEVQAMWRGVSKQELEGRLDKDESGVGAGESLRKAANKMTLAGVMFNQGAQAEGVPIGLLSAIGAKGPIKWGGFVEDDAAEGTGREGNAYAFNVLNPGTYFAGYGVFFNAMADVADMVESLRYTADKFCKDELAKRHVMAGDLQTVSRKQVGNREAFQLEAMMNETYQIAGGSESNLEDVFALLPDVSDISWSSGPTANPANLVAGPRSSATKADIEYTVRKFTLQVDTEYYVPLLIRIEGIVTEDGEPKPYPVIIEKENKLHRQVPGSEMLLPYVEVMRIWGFTDLGPEMEEARREMAKLKAQLAELPASQRAMVEKTMGSKIRSMELMAEGAPMVHETRVEEVILNSNLPHNPTSRANPIVLECMPGDEDCVETDADVPQAEGADTGN